MCCRDKLHRRLWARPRLLANRSKTWRHSFDFSLLLFLLLLLDLSLTFFRRARLVRHELVTATIPKVVQLGQPQCAILARCDWLSAFREWL